MRKLKTIIIEDFEDKSPYVLSLLERSLPGVPVVSLFSSHYEQVEKTYLDGKLNSERIKPKFEPEVAQLQETLKGYELIVTLGKVPLAALTPYSNLNKFRGSFIKAPCGWVMPTYSVGSILKQFSNLVVAQHDLKKASEFNGKVPEGQVWVPETLPELKDYIRRYLEPAGVLACDIETRGGYITEIGFAPNPNEAVVIPLSLNPRGNYWSLKDELEVWALIRGLLGSKLIVGQNFVYDIEYLWKAGVRSINYQGDTMLLQHSLNLEMPKNLGFLASLYTNRSPWKDMRKIHLTFKED